MKAKTTSEAAFETAISEVLLSGGYAALDSGTFDRERAIFPVVVLEFIQATQRRHGRSWKRCTVPKPASVC